MIARRRLKEMVVAAAVMVGAISFGLAANNPPGFDPRDDNVLRPDPPGPGTAPASGTSRVEAPASANPLWGIPLKSLSATRERPIFVPSRRPPAPAVAAAPYIEPAKPSAMPGSIEPERPSLTLVGIVIGSAEGIAVFINDATRDIIRLRTGEGHEGWILSSVKGREVVLVKNQRSAVLELPPPAGEQR